MVSLAPQPQRDSQNSQHRHRQPVRIVLADKVSYTVAVSLAVTTFRGADNVDHELARGRCWNWFSAAGVD
jgi:hypothetical protein